MSRYAVKGRAGEKPILQQAGLEPIYCERTYMASHYLGETEDRLTVRRAGIEIGSWTRAYDVRRLTPEAEAEIDSIDQAIRDLQARKKQLVADGFMSWPIVGKADCAKVLPGRSRKEVEGNMLRRREA